MQPDKQNNIPVHHKINTQQCDYAALYTGSVQNHRPPLIESNMNSVIVYSPYSKPIQYN